MSNWVKKLFDIEPPTHLSALIIDEGGEASAQEYLDLRANLDAAVWLLKELEFSSVSQYDNDLPICPECFSTRTEGHEPSCDLAAFLKRMGAE